MADFLPPAAPSWPSLRELTLKNMNFDEFPEKLAGVLVNVSYLNLADNKFECLPAALTLLSNLEHLEITGNEPLQLVEEDVDFLAAMPKLHTCNMCKSSGDAELETGWSDSSVAIFIKSQRGFPTSSWLSQRSSRCCAVAVGGL